MSTSYEQQLYAQLTKLLGASPWLAAIICFQFGDSGKGKIAHLLAMIADIIGRFHGGPNAGHTVKEGNKQFAQHQVPCGISYDAQGKINVMGSDMVIDLIQLLQEIEKLRKHGFTYDNLKISHRANAILPHHIVWDHVVETDGKQVKIGTTRKGIGPTYGMHCLRLGIKINDLMNPDLFRRRLESSLGFARQLLATVDPGLMQQVLSRPELHNGLFHDPKRIFHTDNIISFYSAIAAQLEPHITDTDMLLRRAYGSSTILLEGAQGFLLDIDRGTYPYVTSSHPTTNGLLKGAGLEHVQPDLTLGIVKAYLTRVGEGPMPTEMGNQYNPDDQALGDVIRTRGNEFGTTTGRPRRVGWLDLPQLRYAAVVQPNTHLVITKPDVLTGLDSIKICTSYTYEGPDYFSAGWLRRGDTLLMANPDSEVMAHCRPNYHLLPGWHHDISTAQHHNDFPSTFRQYLKFIRAEVELPIDIVSVGPERTQTVVMAR